MAHGLEAAAQKGGEGNSALRVPGLVLVALAAPRPRDWAVQPQLASLVQDLENQMHIAEQRRRTLLKDFHDT